MVGLLVKEIAPRRCNKLLESLSIAVVTDSKHPDLTRSPTRPPYSLNERGGVIWRIRKDYTVDIPDISQLERGRDADGMFSGFIVSSVSVLSFLCRLP